MLILVYALNKLRGIMFLINKMSDLNDILAETLDVVDTPKEGVEQSHKRELLKNLLLDGKSTHLLPKWLSLKKLSKLSDIKINEIYDQYLQNEFREKSEKTGRVVASHVINLYSNGACKFLRIDSLEGLKRDINNDPIIRDSMAEIGGLLVYTFGRALAPILVIAHTANHVDFKAVGEDLRNEIDDVMTTEL